MILMGFFMLVVLALPLMLYYSMRQSRQKMMVKYTAFFNAGSPAEALAALRQILAEMIDTEASRNKGPFSRKTVMPLPDSDEECYKRFHYHYLPKKLKALTSSRTAAYTLPAFFAVPIIRALIRGSSLTVILCWIGLCMVLTAAFCVLLMKFVNPWASDEALILNHIDGRAALALKGQPAPPVPPVISGILRQGTEQGEADRVMAMNLPPWVTALVIGVIVAIVACIFLYGFFVWKNFTIDLPPGYNYILDEHRKPVIEELKARVPSERLINCFENRNKDRHLVSSDFTAPAGSVLAGLPDTGDQAVMEAFILEHRGELTEEAAAQGITVTGIKALPLDSGHVTMWVTGNGTDVVNGSPASVEMLTFKVGGHCVRIILTNCTSGDLGAELSNVVKTARFK
jgi:hypothetical protein